ncbi:MAG: hypothetical protein RLZZ335_476, partial [Bacteroidota bacterium]
FLVISQQAVDQFVAYSHFFSSKNNGSFLPNDRLHKNSYTLYSVISRIACTLVR